MADTFATRLKHGWNAFLNRSSEQQEQTWKQETSYGHRPDRTRLFIANERSILTSIYVRMALDIASVGLRHIRVDADDRYTEDMVSDLNHCLRFRANIDQGAQALFIDACLTLFDRGYIAVVPVDTTSSPFDSNSFDIQSLRVGYVTEFRPRSVTVNLYNDRTGRREEVLLEKRFVALTENPLYAIMNEPSSTFQRLIRKLNLLDRSDEDQHSGKLDVIIQLPYTIRSEAQREKAKLRREDMEEQLAGSKYGIAYADATEKITQLNRPVENTLIEEIDRLTAQLYTQLGVTTAIMDGTADEAAILNYYNRTVEPILTALSQSFTNAFITRTALTQGQRIDFFQNRFKLIPLSQLADIADKFTRNEVMTGTELRQLLGIKPSGDPKADELRNSNMPRSDTEIPEEDDGAVDSAFDSVDSTLDGIFSDLGADEDIDTEDDEEEPDEQ